MSIPENFDYSPVLCAANFKAISARDYRGNKLPSIFGPEIKCFSEPEHARAWLTSLSWGGKIERWDESTKASVGGGKTRGSYIHYETVEATK